MLCQVTDHFALRVCAVGSLLEAPTLTAEVAIPHLNGAGLVTNRIFHFKRLPNSEPSKSHLKMHFANICILALDIEGRSRPVSGNTESGLYWSSQTKNK